MRPLILNQLGPSVAEALAAHRSNPRLLEAVPGAPPWDAADAEILLARPELSWLDAPASAPPAWPGRLRWVQVASVGVDFFPRWLLQGPVVTCGRGSNSAAIAEYVLNVLLDREKGLEEHRVRARAQWRPGGKLAELGTLEGRVLGLAGYGSIGRAVAVRARAFGMRIASLRRHDWQDPPDGVEPVADLATLASISDHLVLALPLTGETRHIVGEAVLSAAKPGLHLVNVARGALVDQEALLRALDGDRLGFASLDVTEPEPLPEGHPLYAHPKVRLTPHLSWSGGDGISRLTRKILDNLDAYAEGRTLCDVVDPVLGY